MLKVLMLGPSLNTKGGMTSVQDIIITKLKQGHNLIMYHVATYDDVSAISMLWAFFTSFFKIFYILTFKKIDLVHIHFSHKGDIIRLAVYCYFLSKFKIPIILHAHGSNFEEFYFSLSSRFQNITKIVLSYGKRIIVLSNSIKQFYTNELNFSEDTIIILSNAVNLPKEKIVLSEPNKIFYLFLGELCDRKGAFELIEAICPLKNKLDPNKFQLIMAGNGDLTKAERLISKYKLDDLIKLAGWISSNKKHALLQSCSVFVLPTHFEGLPMAMLEAMSYGLPVIINSVGGIPDVVRDRENGFLIKDGDMDSFINAMLELYATPKLIVDMGNKALETTSTYSSDEYIKRLSNIYMNSKQNK